MDSVDGDSQIDRITRIQENLLRKQMRSQQQPVRPGTTKPYSRGTKTERGLLDTKSSNQRAISTTKDKNVNEFIDFLTPRLANKVYLSWMRGLRSYEKHGKPKQPPQATHTEPFGFTEKYVQRFMEKQRKEVRDYNTSHTSDVTHFIKERKTPSNSTQLYFESSLRGYRPRSKTPGPQEDQLNKSTPANISSEVANRRYKRPPEPKLFNLATTKLRENWGIDKYPQFLPPRIPKSKERFIETPGIIKRKTMTMVKSNSPHSKTQLISALEQPGVNRRVKLNHINMNLARDIMSTTSHSPAGVSWALSLRGNQKFL